MGQFVVHLAGGWPVAGMVSFAQSLDAAAAGPWGLARERHLYERLQIDRGLTRTGTVADLVEWAGLVEDGVVKTLWASGRWMVMVDDVERRITVVVWGEVPMPDRAVAEVITGLLVQCCESMPVMSGTVCAGERDGRRYVDRFANARLSNALMMDPSVVVDYGWQLVVPAPAWVKLDQVAVREFADVVVDVAWPGGSSGVVVRVGEDPAAVGEQRWRRWRALLAPVLVDARLGDGSDLLPWRDGYGYHLFPEDFGEPERYGRQAHAPAPVVFERTDTDAVVDDGLIDGRRPDRLLIEVPVHGDDIANAIPEALLVEGHRGWVWKMTVDWATGRIRDWSSGSEVEVYLKVTDSGVYTLLDENGETLRSYSGYVPERALTMCTDDYLSLQISADGQISRWPNEPSTLDFQVDD